MMKRTKALSASKLLSFLLAIVLCFASMAVFTGCTTQTTETKVSIPLPQPEPPETAPKVHSVVITYNDTAVESTLSVDLSLGSIKLVATVVKDDDATGTLTFNSSNKSVATIDGDGSVTLAGVGETVITAAYGGVTSKIVLVVDSSYKAKYKVTVVGGTASATSASAGDIILLSPAIPEHKEFSDWSFAESKTPVTWISGHTFKMPEGDVTVTAGYTDMLYSLTLVGGKVTADGNDTVKAGAVTGYEGDVKSPEYAITEYKYPFGTELTLSPVTPSDGYMFVGWDANQVNNRLEAEDNIKGFAMPDESTIYWANFSKIETKNLFSANTSNAIAGYNATVLDGSDIPELEGFSGYTVSIPGGSPARSDFPENIHGSTLKTLNASKALRAIFRNRGDREVTVEIFCSYIGNRTTSGWVTVPAGQIVTKTFLALFGFTGDPWWGFAVRENVSAGSNIPLDFVVGVADAYPKGDKTLLLPTGTQPIASNGFVSHFGSIWLNNTGLPQGYYTAATYQHNAEVPAASTARLTNLPAYDPNDPYVTVYIMIQNLASDYVYNYIFAIGKYDNPLNEDKSLKDGVVSVDFEISQYGAIKTFALRIPREEADSIYFSFIKLKYDTPDGSKPTSSGTTYYSCNFLFCATYNNNIGFEGEVIQ